MTRFLIITDDKPYNPYSYHLDRITYIFSVITILSAIIMSIAQNVYDFRIQDMIPPCMLHLLTGYYCPGCGGTRALTSLLKGDLIHSFLYHPVIVYAFIPGVCYMINHTIYHLQRYIYSKSDISKNHITDSHASTSHNRHMIRPLTVRPAYLYSVAALIIIQFIIKNLIKLIWNYSLI